MDAVTADAHQGCYLAIPNTVSEPRERIDYPSWCFGWSDFAGNGDEVPEIALDPDDGILNIINTGVVPRTYFVTVSKCDRVWTADSCDLMVEASKNGRNYVTFVALVPANYSVQICKLEPKARKKRISLSALASVQISSDVQDYDPRVPGGLPVALDTFPLAAGIAEQFVCTQSAGGRLTHFAHPSTFHAVDFRCPVGTPIVALFDAEVVDIRNDSTNSGVRVEDLFAWNSIMIKSVDSELYCEYVHVKKDSFRVQLGDRVRKGDVLCESGAVGFCPEPHLHFEIHRSREPGADSVPITWQGTPFVAGKSYP